jgi:hypothetical protein
VFQGLSGGIRADIGPGAGWPRGSPKKSQVINRIAANLAVAADGTKWNAFIDAGCASHMKKTHSPAGQSLGGIRLMNRSCSTEYKVGITAHQVPPV